MKKYKTVTVEKLEVERIICNCCGREIKKDHYGVPEDYITIKKQWGYNSSFDGEQHKIDICCSCYEKWLNTFTIKPSNKKHNNCKK